MPIRLEKMNAAETEHIAVKSTTTWAMAAAALTQRGGNPAWPLVVKKADGTYAAAAYATLLNAGEVPPETLAENLPGLVPVEAVEKASMSTEEAQNYVGGLRPPKLIVVVEKGKYIGAVKGAHRSSETLPTSKLNQLAGQQVDLSKLGDFLLDE